MKIACIYWPTSSVGGIETELRSLHTEATRRGDIFHVLRSGKHKTIEACLFEERKLIRGGDTFVTIDGELPHHPIQITNSLNFLKDYDLIYFAFLCPHATKDYGNEPLFMPLFTKTKQPKVARITDGYWDSYSHWGNDCLKYLKSASVCQDAYKKAIPSNKVKVANAPLHFPKVSTVKTKSVSTVWTSQWKAIKGIHKLLHYIPKIVGKMDLYSCGILYYQLRTSPEWKAAIKRDEFKGYNGDGKAIYHGWVELAKIPSILSKAWFMIDLQGMGKPKYKVYQQGSINLTTAEALYYGACPVLHEQVLESGIPKNLIVTVSDASEVPKAISSNKEFASNPSRIKKARAWANKNFNVKYLYDKIVLGEWE